MSSKIVSTENITSRIFVIQGQKVMLDRNLAELYGVSTKRLNEQVKRNRQRFPEDFMFQLTRIEVEGLVKNCDRLRQDAFSVLRSQIATSKRGGRRYLPYVFTEQGVAMLSSVLKSKRAVLVNVAIMRAFVKLRETLSLHKELAAKLKELENKVEGHDKAIHDIFEAIRRLMKEGEKPERKIGFHA